MSKTVEIKITEKRLREIVAEELQRKQEIQSESWTPIAGGHDYTDKSKKYDPGQNISIDDYKAIVNLVDNGIPRDRILSSYKAKKLGLQSSDIDDALQMKKNGLLETSTIKEAVDAEGVKTVINASSKLHKALEAFKGDANVALQNALGVDVDKVLSSLEHIIQNPASYTDKAKVEPKRVKLRAVKEDGLNEGKMSWKPEYTLFMHDLLKTKQKTVPVGSKDTKIADDLQDVGMLKVIKQFKGPSGLVVVYGATPEGLEQFQDKGVMKGA